MKTFVASFILLILWELVFVTSPVAGQCPKACRKKIQRTNKRVKALEADSDSDGDEFQLVFSAKSGSGKMVLDSWLATGDHNANDPDADLFKSPLAEEWGTRPVDQVRVEVLAGADVKAYFIFDGRGSSKKTFMSADRLMASSNGNLVEKKFNYFSVTGHNEFNRHFYINANYGGCPVDAGWLVLVDAGSKVACDWSKKSGRPYFLYCEGAGPCKSDGAPVGDTFRILVKFA